MDRWLCLSRKHNIWTVVDDEYYDWITIWNWNYAKSGTCNKIYAKRNVGKARTPVLMHRALLFHACPIPMDLQGRDHRGRWRLVADHEDGNSLNNRISNLRWITKSEDVSNSWINRYREDGQHAKASIRLQALAAMGLQPELFDDEPVLEPSSQKSLNLGRATALVQTGEAASEQVRW